MSKRNYKIYDYNYQGTYNNHIKVNKRPDITSETLKYYNYHKPKKNINSKDNLYYTIDKKSKTQKNKIPLSLNKKYIKKVSQEKVKNAFKYSGRDNLKKTISTYSNENRTKEGNIIEELQNNKYLRPMLCGTNINNKLLKCKIEEPIKNISTLKKFIPNNLEFPFEALKSPIKSIYEKSDESKSNYYNLNNRIPNDKYGFISPKNELMAYKDNKNNNSLFDDNKSYRQANKYLIKYSENYTKKFMDSQPRNQKKKYFYSEERKEKEKDKEKIKRDNNEKFYFYKNSVFLKSPNNNTLKNKNNNLYEKKNTLEMKIKSNKREKNLLLVYKSKLIEEFIIVLNKFFFKYLNKKKSLFFNNFKKHKFKSQSKNKIYFKKKKNNYIKKKLSNNEGNKLILNFDKEKEKEKNKNKATTDTSANFNLNNKSFSNEIKSSSLSNNILSNLFINNNKLTYQNSSFLFTDQKHKNFSQSPEDSIKIPKTQIRTKTIIYKKNNSGSPNRSREASGTDGFIYKKKNLNNENIGINKISNMDLYNNLNKNYNHNIIPNKKGKIIDIDINLGKPINEINDHSPLEELLIKNNEPFTFKLNTISSKFMNKNKRKNKAKSGSKSKIKPPLRLKRFAEEEEDENFINFNIDSYKPVLTYKNERENKLLYLNLDNDINEYNKKKLNEYSKDGNKECKNNKNILFIRYNYYYFKGRKKINNNNYKNLIKEKNISLHLPFKKTKNDLKNGLKKFPNKKVNKLYINCTKFFISTLSKLIKRKIFMMTFKMKKQLKK